MPSKKVKLLLLLTGMNMTFLENSTALSLFVRPPNFVYLHEIDPSIIISLRYASSENFIGAPLPGYINNKALITLQAAEALKKAQQEFLQDGYSLVIYDAYRPQQAVDAFMQWSKEPLNQIKKEQYYPYVNKRDVFKLGYVASHSGHTRGSTVDVTLIKKDSILTTIKETKRTLLDGRTIPFLDDNTVDMGSSFDLFDPVSHYENNLISDEHKKMRLYLKNVMEKHGFKQYPKEWWHFRLEKEPFSDTYFNFPII